MDLAVCWRDEALAVAGELDIATAPTLLDALADAGGRVCVDLGLVTFCDGAGARALVRARHRLLEAGGELALRNPPTTLRIVVATLGLEAELPLDGVGSGPGR